MHPYFKLKNIRSPKERLDAELVSVEFIPLVKNLIARGIAMLAQATDMTKGLRGNGKKVSAALDAYTLDAATVTSAQQALAAAKFDPLMKTIIETQLDLQRDDLTDPEQKFSQKKMKKASQDPMTVRRQVSSRHSAAEHTRGSEAESGCV